jgi:hypothetical protein
MTDRPAPSLPPHVLVVGHGRSGTNMVLDLFDCHRMTFCRNEPNELHGSAFTGLGDAMFGDPEPPDFAARWQQAVQQSIRSNGARDRFGTDKDYFRSDLRARLGQAVMARARLRARLLPRQDGLPVEEWPCPGFHYDHAALARALPVLKILLAPAWTLRAHDLFETQRVVHVIRRPEGFIQSWWSRYVTGIGGGPDRVFADNQPSLARILAHFGRADEMPESYSLRALLVSELWRWRYMNEGLAERLSGSERYLPVPYEAVMADRTDWAEKIYAFAGLEMTEETRAQVEAMRNTLFGERKSDGLEPDLVAAAVDEVTADSAWWKTFGVRNG